MRRTFLRLCGLAAALAIISPAAAQETIKIGLINVTSGQFADAGIQLDNGVKTYMKQHGDTVAGKKIEIIRKDVGGVAPDVAKRLAQELIVRDKVDILAGFLLTPNALAAGDVSAEAKKFMVVMNAATSIITTKSPYMIRTSVTLPQVAETFGTWAVQKAGIKKSYTMVTDYGPGHDFEGGFHARVQGGRRRDRRLGALPGRQPGFLRLRAAREGPQSGIDHDLHSGRRAAGGARQGVRRARRRPDQDQDPGLRRDHRRAGAQEHGRRGARHHHRLALRLHQQGSEERQEFVKLFHEMHRRNPDFFSIGGYDGMHAIYEALKKTGGKTDGDSLIAAAKGLKWDSIRGPMSIDPETRDVVQTIYIRKVEKVGGELINVPFDKVENVKDPVKARMRSSGRSCSSMGDGAGRPRPVAPGEARASRSRASTNPGGGQRCAKMYRGIAAVAGGRCWPQPSAQRAERRSRSAW